MIIKHFSIELKTQSALQFIDITEKVEKFVKESGIQSGIVNVQSKHTTATILVNENEPLFIEDAKKKFESMFPQDAEYGHNDFSKRTVNMCGTDECKNGHSHVGAFFTRTSETLNVIDGKMDFGRWQRIFLVELDHARKREVSVCVLGI